MTTNTVWLKVDGESVVHALQAACEKLGKAEGNVFVDFSGVHRIDPSMLKALAEFAAEANDKSIKVVLGGVNVDVYKVLKLMKLGQRFSFLN